MYNREYAAATFHSYTERYNTQNILIRHKVEHTLRVAELSGRYAKALGMPGEDADLAWLIGLMHDIGRFEQARRYGTFVDSLSVDHAELSADILFREGLADIFPQAGLPEGWAGTAETAIRLHNKLKLPETLNERTKQFAELIRDADKTDIFRVIASIPFEERIGSSRAKFTETDEASPEVMACVLAHRCVPSRILRSRFEGHISHCCYAFDMVFDISRRTVMEEGWLSALLMEKDKEGKQIWTDRETAQLRVVRREIENAWGVSHEKQSTGEKRL
jgi:putative nucleotidyltransferase with HDIG domain